MRLSLKTLSSDIEKSIMSLEPKPEVTEVWIAMTFFSPKFFQKLTRVANDFAITILASVIYTFARQIVVFPILAARLTKNDYGTLLTVVGLATVCTTMIGGILNNIRLVQNSDYEEQGRHGDFNILCAVGEIFSCGISFALWRAFDYSGVTALLLTAYILVSNLYQYATVFFRLNLSFKRILFCNILVSGAYVTAATIFATEIMWPAIFLVGEGVGLVFVVLTTSFHREPFSRTPLFWKTSKKLVAFMCVSLLGNLLLYADRLILYPLLGAESVSCYSTASFFGKSASVVMGPVATVLLSYFSQKGFAASKKLFALVNGTSLLCLGVFLFGCWLLAPWFTQLLYPTLYEQAAPYIMLANIGAAISIAGNMANPMILRCCSSKWILFVQIIYTGAYLFFSMWLLPLYGLLGFCWATIFSNTIRLLTFYVIGFCKFK